MLMKSSNEAAMEAALCLGFLRPGSSTAREFLLQCLCQGPKTQQMKYHFEATQMLKTIGLEQIQAQGLEGFTFDLLRRKTYNETFLAMRQAVAETVEELKMKPTMINLVEVQLINSNATARQEAVISLGVLGICSPQVFHLLLDMLDTENSQSVKESISYKKH